MPLTSGRSVRSREPTGTSDWCAAVGRCRDPRIFSPRAVKRAQNERLRSGKDSVHPSRRKIRSGYQQPRFREIRPVNSEIFKKIRCADPSNTTVDRPPLDG